MKGVIRHLPSKGSIVYPGNFGVFNWGSIAVDPKRQQMFGMPLYLAFTSTLVPKADLDLSETNKGEQGVNSNDGADFAVQLKPFFVAVRGALSTTALGFCCWCGLENRQNSMAA